MRSNFVERHDLDPFALVFGAFYTVIGLAFVLGARNWFGADLGWFPPLLLIALGIAGIVSVTRRRRSSRAA
jgi:hypothetical protein